MEKVKKMQDICKNVKPRDDDSKTLLLQIIDDMKQTAPQDDARLNIDDIKKILNSKGVYT
jgi:hypothetical protein